MYTSTTCLSVICYKPQAVVKAVQVSSSRNVSAVTCHTGAIFGIGGAVALFFYRHKTLFGSTSDHILEGLRNSLLMNVVYGLSSRNIDNW